MLNEIRQEKRRIFERLTHLDVERQKLSDQLNELETAERVLDGLGRKSPATKQQAKRRQATTAPMENEKRRARGRRLVPSLSLNDASLKAVQAHSKGASASEVLNYLTRKFGMAVRPNHLGMALQRHRRAGRLEARDQRWYLASST